MLTRRLTGPALPESFEAMFKKKMFANFFEEIKIIMY